MTLKINDLKSIHVSNSMVKKFNNHLFLIEKDKRGYDINKSKLMQPVNDSPELRHPRTRKALITGMKPAKTDRYVLENDNLMASKNNLAMKVAEREYRLELDLYHSAERMKQLEQEKANILEQLQEIQCKYHSLVRQIPAITYIASIENPGKLLYISPQIDDFGFTAKDWLEDGQGLFKHIHKDDLANVINAFDGVKDHNTLHCEYRIIKKDGQIHWFRNDAGVIRDENNKVAFLQGTLTDITGDKETEQELFYYRQRLGYLVSQRTEQLEIQNSILKSANANLVEELSRVYLDNSALRTGKARFHVLLDTLGEGIIGIDMEGRCNYANAAALGMLGYAKNDFLGLKLNSILYSEGTGDVLLNSAMSCGNGGDPLSDELPPQNTGFFQHKKNGTVFVEYAIYPAWQEGKMTGAVLIFREISVSLRYQATHDSLTGVKNRREFARHAARILASARKDHSEHALCYLDFDHFKMINDSYGHAAGDEFLRALMALIKSKLRAHDSIGRMGGDEFALLLKHSSINQAFSRVKDIADSVNEYRFNWDGKLVSVSVSIGMAPLTGAAANITEVINAADHACLQAKDKGRNQIITWQGS